MSEDGTSYGGVNRQVEQLHGTLEEGQRTTLVAVLTSKSPRATQIVHVTRRVTGDENGDVTSVVGQAHL
jgi:hypothetical protein